MTNYIRPFKSIEGIELLSAPFEKRALDITNKFCQDYGAFLAGSFPLSHISRNKDYNDLDFFFTSKENLDQAVSWITTEFACSEHNEDSPYFAETDFAHTFHVAGKKVQLIKIVSGSLEEVLDTFDFDNCKVAVTWNPQTSKYDFTVGKLVPELVETKKFRFRRQINIELPTEKHKKQLAESNSERLEKYLNRFPGGSYDDETRQHLLIQFAWDCKHMEHKYSAKGKIFVPKCLWNILTSPETPLDEVILFYPFGGTYKEIFDQRSGHGKQDLLTSLLKVPFGV